MADSKPERFDDSLITKVAVLVDGGFYRKRAAKLWGKKTAKDRANELVAYCGDHVRGHYLYRIFYYDCPPIEKVVYHPYLKKAINLKQTETYTWTNEFFEQLKNKRKLALRLGELSDGFANYNLKPEVTKKLFAGTLTIEEITENDFLFTGVEQKGVDMKIGTDIASLAYKKQVNKIILIAGDSDFVPASKLARREGIDFVLDPMWSDIKSNLYEHIDGLQSLWGKSAKKN